MEIGEVKLLFKGETEPFIIRDSDLIEKVPVLSRAFHVATSHPNCNVADTTEILNIPFRREAGEFLFEHLRNYKYPEGISSLKQTNSDDETEKNEGVKESPHLFPEAEDKTLDELKQIIQLSSFFECDEFKNCIASVIAEKLNKLPIEKISEFFGTGTDLKTQEVEKSYEWMHPYMSAFSEENL